MILKRAWLAPFWALICLFGVLFASWSWAADGSIVKRLVAPMYGAQDESHGSYYFSRLLALALDRTVDEFGPYSLDTPDIILTDDRLKAQVVQGGVDVMWHTSIGAGDEGLQVVPISLLGELSHYRALLIRNGDQPLFATVASLDDLRQLDAGIGSQWPGIPVLELNSLPYVTSTRYELLFKMLAARRFDYFPRGLYQIQSEASAYPELDLAIEPSLLLYYPNDVYFFVSEGNDELAARLELGLKRAQADGSMQELMTSIERFRWAQQELARNQRLVLKLKVPE